MPKNGDIEKLMCPDLNHEELLTDGPNNFNQQIETEETTEAKKTLMPTEKWDRVELSASTATVKRNLYIADHTSVFDLFLPHILFATAIIFFLQAICVTIVVFL